MRRLAGKRVLLTASVHTASRFAPALERLGARVVVRSTIELREPSDPAPAARALREVARYDWVVFTSANGVRAFVARHDAAPSAEGRLRGRVAAVGPATAAALGAAGIAVAVVARQADAAGLGAALASRVAAGERALLVGPETGSATLLADLRALGLDVEAVAFYRNAPAAGAGEAAHELLGRAFDAVVFASPSSLARLLEALPEERDALRRALAETRRIAIGSVTGAALAAAGLPADAVSAEPTAEALSRAVVASFEARSPANRGARG